MRMRWGKNCRASSCSIWLQVPHTHKRFLKDFLETSHILSTKRNAAVHVSVLSFHQVCSKQLLGQRKSFKRELFTISQNLPALWLQLDVGLCSCVVPRGTYLILLWFFPSLVYKPELGQNSRGLIPHRLNEVTHEVSSLTAMANTKFMLEYMWIRKACYSHPLLSSLPDGTWYICQTRKLFSGL